jgi:hypothetical protein
MLGGDPEGTDWAGVSPHDRPVDAPETAMAAADEPGVFLQLGTNLRNPGAVRLVVEEASETWASGGEPPARSKARLGIPPILS